MTAEEYYRQYGYQRDQPGWDELSDPDKEMIKQHVPFKDLPSAEEERLRAEHLAEMEAGPDTNIWRGLSEMLGFKPGAIKKFMMGKYMELMERPDFAKEYGLSKKALKQQLMETEQGLAGTFASRGLLDSSAHAAAVGGAVGGYMQSFADLMLGRAEMEQGAYERQMLLAGGMETRGADFAQFLNKQYIQSLGLSAEAIQFLSGERERDYALDIQRYGINPNISDPLTFGDWGPGALGLGAQLAMGGLGGGAPSFNMSGGGGTSPAGNWYEGPMDLFG